MEKEENTRKKSNAVNKLKMVFYYFILTLEDNYKKFGEPNLLSFRIYYVKDKECIVIYMEELKCKRRSKN